MVSVFALRHALVGLLLLNYLRISSTECIASAAVRCLRSCPSACCALLSPLLLYCCRGCFLLVCALCPECVLHASLLYSFTICSGLLTHRP